MLRNSFTFLSRISKKLEMKIWGQGIKDWDSFIKADKIKGISNKKKFFYDDLLVKAKNSLINNDSSFFNLFHSTETWRLYSYFKDEVVFLDIEATRIDKKGEITVIGLYDGLDTKVMIKDINLDIKSLKRELSKYKLIITFNGSSFDIPFIKKRFDFFPEVPHIDLRYLCAACGLSGGLKEIENQLGIKRRIIISNITGGGPATLWRMYKGSGDPYYLDLLIEYNEEDVINLKKIMDHCFTLMKLDFPYYNSQK